MLKDEISLKEKIHNILIPISYILSLSFFAIIGYLAYLVFSLPMAFNDDYNTKIIKAIAAMLSPILAYIGLRFICSVRLVNTGFYSDTIISIITMITFTISIFMSYVYIDVLKNPITFEITWNILQISPILGFAFHIINWIKSNKKTKELITRFENIEKRLTKLEN